MERADLKRWLAGLNQRDLEVVVEEVKAERSRRNRLPENLSERTKSIVGDLELGLPVRQVAAKYHVTRQYVYKLRDKHCR